MKEMLRAAYLAEGEDGYRLVEPLALLEDWSAFYDCGRNEVHSFVVPMAKAQVIEGVRELDPERYALTLLAASDVVAPHVQHEQVHLYAAGSHLASLLGHLRQEWLVEPVPRGGNVHLLNPYYRAATFRGSRVIEGLRVVSNEQLFLDLIGYPVRGREAAAVLARGPLARQLDLSWEQTRELREWVEQ